MLRTRTPPVTNSIEPKPKRALDLEAILEALRSAGGGIPIDI